MATITHDASAAGKSQAVTVKSEAVSRVQVAELFVEISGTYDQAASESVEITNAAAAIQNSRRNGKTVTIIDVMGGQSGYDAAGAKHYHFKTAVYSASIIEATIFEVGGSELADGSVPALNQPLSVYALFTEA